MWRENDKKRANDIIKTSSPAPIVEASKIILEEELSGISKIIDFAEKSEINLKSLKEACKNNSNISENLPTQALKMLIKLDLSQANYQLLRNNAKFNNLSMSFPSYKRFYAEKLSCLPSQITFSENIGFVEAGDSISLTVSRIFETHEINPNLGDSIQIKLKFGIDGATSNSMYHQKFFYTLNSDEYIMSGSYIILDITLNKNEIVYTNPSPNSIEPLRPLFICFRKETDKETCDFFETIKEQAENLTQFKFKNNYHEISVSSHATMLDGKAVSAICKNKSTLKCPV